MSDAPIVQKISDLYRGLYAVVGRMPKRDKYTIGQRIEQTALQLLEYTVAASHATKLRKPSLLEQAGMKLDLLRVLIRLSEELKAIPTKRYLECAERLDEIGRMLGGWRRSLP